MTRKSIEEKINELDHAACQRVLILVSKGVEFSIAMKSEAAKKKAKETSEQEVLV